MLIGTATRFIAGRNAVQTVYWRTSKDVQGLKMVKYNRTCNFGKNASPPNSTKITQITKSH